jgi:defect-in-organelle-trafficking protein DotB
MTDDIRKRLYAVGEDEITQELTELVNTFGRPLMMDIEEHYEAGRIDQRTYDRYKAEAS